MTSGKIHQVTNELYAGEHVLDTPMAFHEKLLGYGERPYWSPDGKRIAFIEKNYGDVCEIDLETRQVKQLTKELGDHHSFLRVLFLPSGDYILIGPKEFKDRRTSRAIESELWFMDKDAKRPPKPLGRAIFEGCGVSTIANRITFSVNGLHDPSVGAADDFAVIVADVDASNPDDPKLANERIVYRASGGVRPEPQDFRHNDSEIIMAEYINDPWGRHGPKDDWKCIVSGIKLDTLERTVYIDEPLTHNECEGIFPDHEYICLESSCDEVNSYPPLDLWKLKLDGSGRRVRMTRFFERYPWRASNSNVSPDGKRMAFMVNMVNSEAGFGMGLGLFDLEGWEKSPYAQQWETPASRAQDREAKRLES
ncbi:hypothetical protein [Paenibacillus sp.]|uniref:TolB family protein n=1 Tax=Paenibacillus sp. TaxID=58172 RepID=UPI002D4B8D81|nr:hypothetical protein [Paenibacillus sp.]HZG88134.1 hypothetical protein [Paenibacillus sp.]